MAEYGELAKVGEDGLDFTGKTALWMAYERQLESEKPEGERLFYDHLAKHFTGGGVGKRMSDTMTYGLKAIFDATGDIGLGNEGHVNCTAARTQLINDKTATWLQATDGEKQVLNLGAGVDTRAYWMDTLKDCNLYLEVDTKAVSDSKQKVLDELKAKGELNDPICERKVIALDFSKESTKDLPNHRFNQDVPTCWILEGLVMYLKKEDNEKLMEELSALSAPGSYAILNFMAANPACKPDELDAVITAQGWTKEETTYFGDKDFNYGRYPEGKDSNLMFGFSFYKKLTYLLILICFEALNPA